MSDETATFLRNIANHGIHKDTFIIKNGAKVTYFGVRHDVNLLPSHTPHIEIAVSNSDVVVIEGAGNLLSLYPTDEHERISLGYFNGIVQIALKHQKPLVIADAKLGRTGWWDLVTLPFFFGIFTSIYDKLHYIERGEAIPRRIFFNLAAHIGVICALEYNETGLYLRRALRRPSFIDRFIFNEDDRLLPDIQNYRDRFVAQTIRALTESGFEQITVIYGGAHYQATKHYLTSLESSPDRIENALKTPTDALWSLLATKPIFFLPDQNSQKYTGVSREEFVRHRRTSNNPTQS